MKLINSATTSQRNALTLAVGAFFLQLLLNIASSSLLSKKIRMWLYRALGVQMSSGVSIGVNCHLSRLHLSNIHLHQNVSINARCVLEAGATITIEKETAIGTDAKILTTTHTIGGSERRTGDSFECRPVRIGAGCWIGAGVIVLPGCKIAKGCVVAAGAVVSKSLAEPDCLYAGVPARLLRKLEDQSSPQSSVKISPNTGIIAV